MSKVRCHIVMEPELYEKLKALAEHEDRSFNNLCCRLLSEASSAAMLNRIEKFTQPAYELERLASEAKENSK